MVDNEDYEDILSLGLLILEIEAKRKIEPVAEDREWDSDLPSKDSMLRRALEEWKRRLEDPYRRLGQACLQFNELTQKFYHPALPDKMRRTAAIYRYILVPLHQLIAQRYCSTSLLFKGFPRSWKTFVDPFSATTKPLWANNLVLFDDSEPHSTWHDPT